MGVEGLRLAEFKVSGVRGDVWVKVNVVQPGQTGGCKLGLTIRPQVKG